MRPSRPAGRALALIIAVTTAACGHAPPPAVPGTGGAGSGSAAVVAPLVATPLELATLEARREAGVERLLELARRGDAATRAGAVRGLGRVGGAAAIAGLADLARADADLALAASAAAALGVLAATSTLTADDAAAVAAAVSAAAARPGIAGAVVAAALGAAGDARALPQLTAWVASPDAAVAAAAARALGRFGRRKLALDEPARAALRARVADLDRDVRFGVLYALGREFRAAGAAPDAVTDAALLARMMDGDADIRAVVIAGLARRGPLGEAEPLFVAALDDAEPRVAVEAVRAIATGGSPTAYAGLGDRILRWVRTLATRDGTAGIHPLLEALRAVMPIARQPPIANALDGAMVDLDAQLARADAASISLGWAHCLTRAALERARPLRFDGGRRLLACGGGRLGAPEQAALLAEISLGIRDDGDPVRARALEIAKAMLASAQPRVHAAAFSMIAPIWASLGDADRTLLAASLALGVDAAMPAEAAAAAEALGTILEAVPPGQAPPPVLAKATDALIARASRETDAELATSLLAAIGTGRLVDGQPACRGAAAAASPVIAGAGVACLTALGAAPTDAPRSPTTAPPLEVAAVLGKRVTWTVQFSRGTIVMDLWPELAPWNVADLVTLTQRGYFDGLVVHRVVPNFVVQTGDPTGTGWGGPGYAVPSEPAGAADGRTFGLGAVGIADAGKDTGGSQWFVMTGPAPHLDATYTQVGQVRSGQDIAERIVVGDTIVKATVAVE